MREFFKGWRRKIGCAALVMACVFTAGWVRSFYCLDKGVIPVANTVSVEFSSAHSKFCLLRFSGSRRSEWKTSRLEGSDHHYSLLTADWSNSFGGLRLFSNLHAFGVETAGIVVPYWIPAIPLILLAACLILWPRRKLLPSGVSPMREFFKGWRRKVGCVALALACLVSGMSVRSYFTVDLVRLPLLGRQHVICSLSGGLIGTAFDNAKARWGLQLDSGLDAGELEAAMSSTPDSEVTLREWDMPYWLLISPLTFLSAYLILWPSRKPET